MIRDYKGEVVYTSFRGGHYEFQSAINPTKNLVLQADPTKGLKIYNYNQLTYGCKYTEQLLRVPGYIIATGK